MPARAPNGRFVGAGGAARAERRPARRPLPRARAVVAAVQRAGAPARHGPGRAAARAHPLPRDLRQQPRRVLHGAGRRAQAAHRHRPRRAHRRRARAARADRAHRPPRARADAAARRRLPARRAARRSRTRASPSCAGTTSTRTTASRSTSSSPTASSPCSRRSPSTRPTPSPTSPASRSTSPCCCRTRRPAPSTSPASRCRRACPASSSSRRTSTPRSSASASSRSRTSSRATSTSSSPGMLVQEHFSFRVTRNEDLEVEEDDAENLLTALEKELTRRRFGPPIRLEVEEEIDPKVLDMLARELQISDREIYRLPTPLDLRGLFTVADVDRSDLEFPKFFPRTHPDFAPTESAKAIDLLTAVRRRTSSSSTPTTRSRRRCRPSSSRRRATPRSSRSSRRSTAPPATRRSSTPSSTPPRRASRCSPSSRSRPASTRSTTSRGPASSRRPASTSSTASSASRPTPSCASSCARSPRGSCATATSAPATTTRKTARVYEDFGLFTTDPQVGEDLSRLFNLLSGFAPRSKFKRLLVAPRSVRSGLIDLVERGDRAPRGRAARARRPAASSSRPTRSSTRRSSTRSTGRASPASSVDIWVRGICALAPRRRGPLREHPGALDPRPLPRALAGLLVRPRRRPAGLHRQRRHDAPQPRPPGRGARAHRRAQPHRRARRPLDLAFAETTSRWDLGSDGRWVRHHLSEAGEPLDDLQEKLIERHDKRRRKARRR